MINYNLQDKYLDKIQMENQDMDSFRTTHNYHIFGLKQGSRPPIRLVANSNGYPYGSQIDRITRFLNNNGIQCEFYDDGEDKWISIGLRLDVRKNYKIAARIVRTLVFHMENRLNLDVNFKFKHPEYEPFEE